MEEMTIVSNNPNIVVILFAVLLIAYLIFVGIRILIDVKRKKRLQNILKEIKSKRK